MFAPGDVIPGDVIDSLTPRRLQQQVAYRRIRKMEVAPEPLEQDGKQAVGPVKQPPASGAAPVLLEKKPGGWYFFDNGEVCHGTKALAAFCEEHGIEVD
jgi:hypothetical protein